MTLRIEDPKEPVQGAAKLPDGWTIRITVERPDGLRWGVVRRVLHSEVERAGRNAVLGQYHKASDEMRKKLETDL